MILCVRFQDYERQSVSQFAICETDFFSVKSFAAGEKEILVPDRIFKMCVAWQLGTHINFDQWDNATCEWVHYFGYLIHWDEAENVVRISEKRPEESK